MRVEWRLVRWLVRFAAATRTGYGSTAFKASSSLLYTVSLLRQRLLLLLPESYPA